MRRSLLLPAALLAGALPVAAAQAQSPLPTQPQPAPEAAPAPEKPKRLGLVSLSALSGLSDRGDAYAMRGQRVRVRGRLRGFAEGQLATVEIYRSKRRAAVARARVVKARRGGRFTLHFTARRTGNYSLRARVKDGEGVLAARSKKRLVVRSVSPRAGSGSGGARVRLLQRGLGRLGYAVPHSGSFDGGTARAVIAFRKTNSMRRTGFASRQVYSMLFRGKGGFKLKYPRAGKHVEYDWSRQVLVLALGGRAERIYHSSSGAPATPTVFGSFRFYRKQPGTNAKGMVHSNYFIRGYAIHGYKSVPTHPASHGCLRVPIANALSIFRWVNFGDRIFVYR